MSRTKYLLAAVLLTAGSLLGACGDDDTATDADTATADDGGAATGDDTVGGGGDGGGGGDDDTVQASVSDGPDAGDYERSGVNANCSVGLAGSDVFGIQYSDETVEDGLSSLQVMVNDGAAAAGGVDDFTAMIRVGGTSYHFEDGTATVDIDADDPTLEIEGTASDGIELSASVECGSVLRS